MEKSSVLNKGIPVSVSLLSTLEAEELGSKTNLNQQRILYIAFIATLIAIIVSCIARLLVYLINIVTNISYYGKLSISGTSPAANHLGWLVIFIPAIGGIIVGLMALYGSKAIRGHGIPEAMEQILINQSKIRPSIAYLKPISSAIAIGTGGPFGAEGPIIATGGALGSTIGQLLKITHNERKILLASGATAGMSAIFGSPAAAILLAIELLLFEFSPRSIIPVTLACITGAAGHHFLFDPAPVFEMAFIPAATGNMALGIYSAMGVVLGLLAVLITKIIYLIEDGFEKLPIHWMWWPAIAGLAVGVIGYIAPKTLGVGYNNITDLLSGSLGIPVIASLCLYKFLSWSIALGSGTSGGTLAPLLTIGAAAGALLGYLSELLFPAISISIPLSALVGMSAMFAGASRAFLTSIFFALETTSQSNALLPLLATCSASYIVSFFLMENTIMTEKIARRGVKAPELYEPDILEKVVVEQVMEKNGLVISGDNTIKEVIEWLNREPEYNRNYFVIAGNDGDYKGILSSSNLFSRHHQTDATVGSLIKRKDIYVDAKDILKVAVEKMAKENIDLLPVLSKDVGVIGILSYQNILSSYKRNADEHLQKKSTISLKRNGLKILVHGQKIMNGFKR